MIETMFGDFEIQDYVIFLIISGGGSLGCLIGIFRYYRLARFIEDTPTSKIRSAAQGYIELEGRTRAFEGSELQAPLTGKNCVWYRYEVEKYVRRGKNSHWVTVKAETSDAPFILDDTTGECVVEPYGADVRASRGNIWYGGTPRPVNLPPRKRSSWVSLNGKRYRYTEERIVKDEFVYSLGYFETVNPVSRGFEKGRAIRDIITGWKQDYDVMVDRFDADRDGKIDLEEWKQVRAAAALEADQQRTEFEAGEPMHVLARSPGRDYPFLIGTHEQRDLASRFRRSALGCLIGFLLLGSLATGLITGVL